MYDIIIRGGTVIDGTGKPGYKADVAVKDGKIAAIGDLSGLEAEKVLDASGLAVAPGFIGTEKELAGYDEEVLKQETEKILLKRYGQPEEVARLVRFLVSEEAAYINNSVIRIDGGQMGSC